MEFKEFSEFPDLEEEDFDIKHAFSSDPNNYSTDPDPSDPEVFEEDDILGEVDLEGFEDAVDVDEESILEEDSLDSLDNQTPIVQEEPILEEDILEEDSLDDLVDSEPVSVDASVLEEDSYDPSEWGLEQIESSLEEDIFEDSNIQDTLQRYNYDYPTLVMMLFAFSGDDEILETLEACGLSKNDYYHPTAETFELMRNQLINNHVHRK